MSASPRRAFEPLREERPQRTVKEMPPTLQPREQFALRGPEKVDDWVLLAILLRTGARGMPVDRLAKELLEQFGSLTHLARVSLEELDGFLGIGKVKAQILKAALELGVRLAREGVVDRAQVTTPEQAVGVIRTLARVRDAESVWIVLLDTKHRLLRPPVEVTSGLADSCQLDSRTVFKHALRAGAASVVLVHNHPSGDPTPSAEDLRITRQIIAAGKVVGVRLLDHVILGLHAPGRDHDFVSLRESGLLEFDP